MNYIKLELIIRTDKFFKENNKCKNFKKCAETLYFPKVDANHFF